MTGEQYLVGSKIKVASYTPRADVAKMLEDYQRIHDPEFKSGDITLLSLHLNDADVKDIVSWGAEYVTEIAWFVRTFDPNNFSVTGLYVMVRLWIDLNKGVNPVDLIGYLNQKMQSFVDKTGPVAFHQGKEVAHLTSLVRQRELDLHNRKHGIKPTPKPSLRPASFGSWA